ncbi:uncharacterized protein F4822DRAFT_396843 [Hypoxylon trugodes]|uniref:uncharacterized protein n=1 Tax=Hypoxylon trugodes TaxID=326681 RepID=UPI002190FDE9|nr:uncharacterized protein F4822DRAFT_396843 [Hypoxylon trugodes]KAI1391475.1 hypothetical protein F4822DRAFT_396843 [Hypoxylon trugodes]
MATIVSTLYNNGGQPIPTCMVCDGPGIREITRKSNRNGNAGRFYYKCQDCNRFINFDDDRGWNPQNPICCCGIPSRRQITGRKKVPGKLHFVCRFGSCDFFGWERNAEGSQMVVPETLIGGLAGLKII